MNPRTGILAGLRVVELSAFVAAPFSGAFLASLGADVIRIEDIRGGIDSKRWPMHDGRSLYRAGLDKGKRSLAVDLKSERASELIVDLVAAPGNHAGIFVTNLPACSPLSFSDLQQRREDIIMVEVLGTPDHGAAVDYTVNAGIGFPFITGPESFDGPVNHVLPIWDLAAGLMVATGLIAAERHRHLTGEGQHVKIALSDVALTVAAHLGYLDEAKLVAEPRGRFGNSIYGSYGHDFETVDGRRVMVCALTERQWRCLVAATDLSNAVKSLEDRESIDLAREEERFEHRHEIDRLVGAWIASRTLVEVGTAFSHHGVLWGPYRTFKQLLAEDPRATEPPDNALWFSAFADSRGVADAPRLGDDTDDILGQILGLGQAEIDQLQASGIVGISEPHDA